MFKNPFDFSKVRTGNEAFGFYLTHLLVIILVAFVVEFIFLLSGGSNAASYGSMVTEVIIGLWSLALSFLVLRGHAQMSNIGYIALAVLAGLIGLIGFGLLGLIIPAYLTTRSSLPKKQPSIEPKL